jgi:hypothetical protein
VFPKRVCWKNQAPVRISINNENRINARTARSQVRGDRCPCGAPGVRPLERPEGYTLAATTSVFLVGGGVRDPSAPRLRL